MFKELKALDKHYSETINKSVAKSMETEDRKLLETIRYWLFRRQKGQIRPEEVVKWLVKITKHLDGVSKT